MAAAPVAGAGAWGLAGGMHRMGPCRASGEYKSPAMATNFVPIFVDAVHLLAKMARSETTGPVGYV